MTDIVENAVKPMQCNFCPRVFDRWADLQIHIKDEHNNGVPRSEMPKDGTGISAPLGEPHGSPWGTGVSAPRQQSPFLNMQTLYGIFNSRKSDHVNAIITEVKPLRRGNFGPAWDCILKIEGGEEYTLSIKQDSSNHAELFSAFGNQWAGRGVRLSITYTDSGNAKLITTPILA